MTTENQNQVPTGNAAGAAQPPQQSQAPQSTFEELKQKKGIKDQEDLAKVYVDLEKGHSKTANAFNNAKLDIEQQSGGTLTLDESGKVIQKQPDVQNNIGNFQQPPQNQPPFQQQYQQNAVWDEYQQKYVTDPIEIQLSKYPPYQRQAMIAQSIFDHNSKLQSQAMAIEKEILNKPEAKGFEEDVKSIINSLPPQMRVDKKNWDNALLQAKGARYDIEKQRWGQQGVEDFLNVQGNQGIPAAGQANVNSTKLSPDLEKSYMWYAKNKPGEFKDRAEFLKYCSPNGGI